MAGTVFASSGPMQGPAPMCHLETPPTKKHLFPTPSPSPAKSKTTLKPPIFPGIASRDADHAASHLGKAAGICLVLRGTPFQAARRRALLPVEVCARHKVSQEELFRWALLPAPCPARPSKTSGSGSRSERVTEENQYHLPDTPKPLPKTQCHWPHEMLPPRCATAQGPARQRAPEGRRPGAGVSSPRPPSRVPRAGLPPTARHCAAAAASGACWRVPWGP